MKTAFTNVRVFDGKTASLSAQTRVTVDGQFIEAVGEPRGEGVQIDGAGHTLMPGLIDAHWHSTLASITMLEMVTSDPRYLMLRAAHQSEQTLLRGFTSVRDTGGPAFPLKRAIDEGLVSGPRIYPSCQRIGHAPGGRSLGSGSADSSSPVGRSRGRL